MVEKKVSQGVTNNMTSDQFTRYLAECLAYLNIKHPDYAILASRVIVRQLHKTTHSCVLEYAKNITNFKDVANRTCHLLAASTLEVYENHHKELQDIIKYERDYDYDIFGFKTLEKSYLLKKDGKVAERPQQLILRVSVGIHGNNMQKVKETYDLMSQKWFTHATPTLFNSGTPQP